MGWLFMLWLYFDIDDVGTHFIFSFGYPASLKYTTLRRTLHDNLVLINNTISLHLLILILAIVIIILVSTSLISTNFLAITTSYNILGSPRIVVVPTLYLINSLIIVILCVVVVV